jgi:hypothetical protein
MPKPLESYGIAYLNITRHYAPACRRPRSKFFNKTSHCICFAPFSKSNENINETKQIDANPKPLTTRAPRDMTFWAPKTLEFW